MEINMLKTIKSKCYLFRRELCIFILLFLTFLCTLPDTLHEWNSAWFAMDYSLGFDSRLFIGSLLRLFYPDFLPAEAAYTFVSITILLFLFVLSYILGYTLRTAEGTKAQTGLLILITLYLLGPGSPAYLWTQENFGRFDIFLLFITLLAAVFCFKASSAPARLIVLTLAGLAALCIHQAFMLIFFPLLFVLLADVMFEKKNSKAFILAGLVCCMLLAIVFLYFQLFSQIKASGIEELTAALSQRTSLPVNEVALRYEYFASTSQSSKELVMNGLGERLRYGAVTLFLLTPFGGIFLFLWKSILKEASRSKWKYWLILAGNAAFIPAFALTIDWGRWFGALLTVLTLQIVFLAAKKDAPVLAGLTRLTLTFHKHPYLFILTGLWLGSLSKFQATLLPDAPVFFTSLYKLYSLF